MTASPENPSGSMFRFEDDGKTARAFLVTDFTFHRRKVTNPASFPRKIAKSAKNGKPGRAYTKDFEVRENGKRVEFEAAFPIPEKDQKLLKKFEEKGRKIVFLMPKNIPIYFDLS